MTVYGRQYQDDGRMLALGYYFDGALDDLRIYDRALGEDEVSLLALGTGSEDFEYDRLGNRLSVIGRDGTLATYAVDEGTNRYDATADGSHDVECVYDEAGNLIQDQNGYEFEYDYENRLVKVSKDSALIAAYVYDALGRRIIVEDAVAEETTYYFYDNGWRVLSETDDAGLNLKNYIYGNYLDEVLVISDDTDDMYCMQDHLYSVVALLDDAGDIIERYEYDAYGKPTFLNANFSTKTIQTSSYNNNRLFTGKQLDILDDGDYRSQYSLHRTYDISLGRFYQQDPLGIVPNAFKPNRFKPRNQYTDGMNVYGYVKSKPANKIDSHGLMDPIMFPGMYKPGFAGNLRNTCGTCGPDVTHALALFEGEVINWFNNLSSADRNDYCDGKEGSDGWDIDDFVDYTVNTGLGSSICGTGDCKQTVQVGSGCYVAFEVNYYFYGLMYKLCRDSGEDKFMPSFWARTWPHAAKVGTIVGHPYSPTTCKAEWFRQGANGNFPWNGVGKCNRTYCKSCGVRFARPLQGHIKNKKTGQNKNLYGEECSFCDDPLREIIK